MSVLSTKMASSSANNTLSKKYQKKSDREHVLDNPDTYVGSIEKVITQDFVYDSENNKIINKEFQYIPGLYKLFDEGVVNCRDHVIRMEQKKENGEKVNLVTQISVDINKQEITMMNDGNGIDIVKHPEYDIWIPELIFGHLRTSTNYDKSEKKIVGGKNGFGFKLVLIWSSYGRIETVDSERKLKYIQEFKENLTVIEKPKITKCSTKPYTKVTFTPDFKRLGMSDFSDDMIRLFQKRVYDIAGVTDKKIKVKLNGNILPINQFENYVNMYIGNKTDIPRVTEKQDRWEYTVCISPFDEFRQVSFVNGIYTQKGGKHVEYIVNQITKKMCELILKKKKIKVKPISIKEQLFIFVNSTIENPAFDSQTKDYLNTPVSKFGSTCQVSDKFMNGLVKLGVMNTACALTDIKDKKQSSKTDGNKCKSIRGIPKLVDANYAGTNKSNNCTLILCEGDSAKAGIISGLSTEDRNFIGVYPMKGKMMNVRGEATKKINDNKEIIEIKKIIGLESNRKYTIDDLNSLRYGKILFMTDQDLDGTHIKGLGLNLIEYIWPTLLEIPEFIGFMNTPILKATKNNKTYDFYNEGEFENWKKTIDIKGWKIKYYKGLGTSTNKEFKEYFNQKKIVTFDYDKEEREYIDMVFNKKRADDRKKWLGEYDRQTFLDTSKNSVSYKDFIEKEMIHFSKYDNDRSIPNIMDGFKISQRKIIYSAFKKNLTQEIKVAQFSGYVSEHSGYHHGEASLNGAIVNMAQTFVGSNNINLFEPNGQFGTRLMGGKDSASERYIFTKLNQITYKIFKKEDQHVLTYLEDDGDPVEPIYYVPIIPMILVNGTKGIGTGFSTTIPCYNPKEITNYIINKLNDNNELNESINFIPYYNGFKGEIIQTEPNKYISNGKYSINYDKGIMTITELPIGTWTDDYKKYLEDCIDKKQYGIKDYNDLSTNIDVCFEVVFQKSIITKYKNKEDKLVKDFKLSGSINSLNMNLFDSNEKLKNYNDVKDIINDFYDIRLKFYQKRKDHLIERLSRECDILKNKKNYINEILNETIDLRKKKYDVICKILLDKNYMKLDNKFDYLIKMPMDSVSEENVEELMNKYNIKYDELKRVISTSINQMWINDINVLLQDSLFKKMF